MVTFGQLLLQWKTLHPTGIPYTMISFVISYYQALNWRTGGYHSRKGDIASLSPTGLTDISTFDCPSTTKPSGNR